MASPYDVLGIGPDADDATVVRAYRERVKETHPDQGGSASEFQAVRTAYERILAGDVEDDPALDEGGSAPEPPTETRVEYLNYEVLADHGWEMDDDDLFEKAADAGLDDRDYGRFVVRPHESLLEGAESRGFAWPFACRGGACANCAVAVLEGELAQPVDHILSEELLDRNIRLSCNGVPLTDELRVVYNLKHLPDLEELRLPPGPFEHAHPNEV